MQKYCTIIQTKELALWSYYLIELLQGWMILKKIDASGRSRIDCSRGHALADYEEKRRARLDEHTVVAFIKITFAVLMGMKTA